MKKEQSKSEDSEKNGDTCHHVYLRSTQASVQMREFRFL